MSLGRMVRTPGPLVSPGGELSPFCSNPPGSAMGTHGRGDEAGVGMG